MNPTIFENGLVLASLGFGTLPRFSVRNTNFSKQEKNLLAFKAAQAKIKSTVAQKLLLEALQDRILIALGCVYNVGKNVSIHSKTNKNWLGLLGTVHAKCKIATVKT